MIGNTLQTLIRTKSEGPIPRARKEVRRTLNNLNGQAVLARQAARHRADLVKNKAQTRATAFGSKAGALAALGAFGSRDGAPRRRLTRRYTTSLANKVEKRVKKGGSLRTAMREVLREQAPVRLERPRRFKRLRLGRVLGALGLTLGLGLFLSFLWQRYRGQKQVERLQHETTPERSYRPIHGTAGAEMPAPDRASTASEDSARRAELPVPERHTPDLGAPSAERREA